MKLNEIRILLNGKKVKAEKYFTCDKDYILIAYDSLVNMEDYFKRGKYNLSMRFGDVIIEIGLMYLVDIIFENEVCVLKFQYV